MDYRYGSYTVFKIQYPFVFVTQYRYQVLKGDIALKIRDLIRQTGEAFEIEILKGVVSKDHIHIWGSAPPNLVLSEIIMRRIKGRSTTKLFEAYPELRKRYWSRHFWARGYFCVTSGEVTEEMIKEYLEYHFEPRVDDHFRMEAP
jgi:putative transposase